MLPLRHRDPRRHFRRLELLVERLDVGKLEQLHAVQPPLGVLHEAPAIQIAWLVGQLAANHIVADALVAGHFHRTEVGDLARFGDEPQRGFLRGRSRLLLRVHLRVRKAVVAQLVDRQFVSRHHQLAVARLTHLQRRARSHFGQVRFRNDVEADEFDGCDLDRLSLRHGDGQLDGILFVVELDVESGDAGIGISAIGVKGLDAFEIRLEPRTVEVVLLAPGDDRAFLGRQHRSKARLVDRIDALEGKRLDRDGSSFFTRRRDDDETKKRERRQSTHEPPHMWRSVNHNPCQVHGAARIDLGVVRAQRRSDLAGVDRPGLTVRPALIRGRSWWEAWSSPQGGSPGRRR